MQYDEGRMQLHTEKPDESGQYKCVTAIIATQQLSLEMCRDEDERQKWTFEKKVIGTTKRIVDFPFLNESNEPPPVRITPPPPTVRRNNNRKTKQRTEEEPEFHDGEISKYITEENLEKLRQEHRQFVDHKFNENLNVLAEEVKEVYCQDLEIKRFQALLLAQTNGLIAARALGLGICERIESSGMTLILQKCNVETIAITAKRTRCGYQPYYENQNKVPYTIGKDGWSLHTFMECFWTGPYVNLNGQTYSYKNDKWSVEQPTIHFNKLKIVRTFEQLPSNALDFAPKHHSAFESHNIEQLNIFSELISRVQESNSESLSDLVMDVQSKNNVWDMTGWMIYIKYGLLGLACLIVVIIILVIIIKFRQAISLSITKVAPQKWKRKQKQEEQETTIALIQPASPYSPSAPPNTPHDHTDTLFINGKLFWKDMCPILPLLQQLENK